MTMSTALRMISDAMAGLRSLRSAPQPIAMNQASCQFAESVVSAWKQKPFAAGRGSGYDRLVGAAQRPLRTAQFLVKSCGGKFPRATGSRRHMCYAPAPDALKSIGADFVAKLFCPSEGVGLIQDQALMRK